MCGSSNVPKGQQALPQESITAHWKCEPCSAHGAEATLTNPRRPSAQPAPTALQGVSLIPCVRSFAEAATLNHHYAEAGFITPILKRGTEA